MVAGHRPGDGDTGEAGLPRRPARPARPAHASTTLRRVTANAVARLVTTGSQTPTRRPRAPTFAGAARRPPRSPPPSLPFAADAAYVTGRAWSSTGSVAE